MPRSVLVPVWFWKNRKLGWNLPSPATILASSISTGGLVAEAS